MFNIVKLENILLNEEVKARFNNVCGIYGIISQNEICYIGQTKNVFKRWTQHLYHIQKPQNKCKKYSGDFKPPYPQLRNDYNSFKNIYFILLESVSDARDLVDKEKYYLNEIRPKYNKRF